MNSTNLKENPGQLLAVTHGRIAGFQTFKNKRPQALQLMENPKNLNNFAKISPEN